MICPACQRELAELTTGGITLDVCHGGCGGIWFDKDELEKLNESEDADEDFLLNVPVDSAVEISDNVPRSCPRCEEHPRMKQIVMGGDDGVRIDSCRSCQGTWLDHGELARVQEY